MAKKHKNSLDFLAINGASLALVSKDKDLQSQMLELLVQANSVVFCRMSPS